MRVVEVGPRLTLYVDGRRRILPSLVFGWHVLGHLARRGRGYDIVYTCSFPYFPLLAAAPVRRRRGFELAVDWIEVWTREYWREYLGPAGVVGWAVQLLCIRLRQQAFCLSELHARRLCESGLRGPVTVRRGLYSARQGQALAGVAARTASPARAALPAQAPPPSRSLPSRWSCTPAGTSPRSG